MRFYSSFFTFFWLHSIKDKAEVQTFKNFLKWSVQFSYIIGFSRLPRYRRKHTVSLRVFGENATFHSAYSPKSRNSVPSLSMLYTAESAQFNSPFSPTTISLTPRFRQKRGVWLPFFAENAQNHPKTHSYEDNAKFHSGRRQRSAMLRAFGEIGEWSKISNIWTNLKKIFENVECTAFFIY